MVWPRLFLSLVCTCMNGRYPSVCFLSRPSCRLYLQLFGLGPLSTVTVSTKINNDDCLAVRDPHYHMETRRHDVV